MATDAVTLIMNDHRLFEQIFEMLQSGAGDRRKLLNECAARLTAHSHAEEMKVYPALAQADPSESAEVHHGADEHHQAEMMLLKLQRLDSRSQEFESALNQFIDAVKHHIEEEETEILPSMREKLDQPTLEQLGAEFERIRREELQVAGITGDEIMSTSATSSRSSDDEMSKAELYAEAKKADIAGRSQMTKEELAEALRSKNGG
jgi:hemerythrin superfamily protein